MRPIVKPGTPWWVRGFTRDPKEVFAAETLGVCGVFVVAVTVVLLLGLLAGVSPAVLFGVVTPAAIGAAFAGTRRFDRAVVDGQAPQYGGTSIAGEGRDLLEDIDARFEYAQRVMAELPAAFGEVEVDEEVNALLWEAAGHAARTSALDTKLVGLRYAKPGTAAWVLREELTASRAAHLGELRAIQHRADALASLAGEASASATVALERTGSAYELEIVTPGPAQLTTASAIEAAKERLRFASSVWGELDETTAVRRAQQESEQPRPLEG